MPGLHKVPHRPSGATGTGSSSEAAMMNMSTEEYDYIESLDLDSDLDDSEFGGYHGAVVGSIEVSRLSSTNTSHRHRSRESRSERSSSNLVEYQDSITIISDVNSSTQLSSIPSRPRPRPRGGGNSSTSSSSGHPILHNQQQVEQKVSSHWRQPPPPSSSSQQQPHPKRQQSSHRGDDHDAVDLPAWALDLGDESSKDEETTWYTKQSHGTKQLLKQGLASIREARQAAMEAIHTTISPSSTAAAVAPSVHHNHDDYSEADASRLVHSNLNQSSDETSTDHRGRSRVRRASTEPRPRRTTTSSSTPLDPYSEETEEDGESESSSTGGVKQPPPLTHTRIDYRSTLIKDGTVPKKPSSLLALSKASRQVRPMEIQRPSSLSALSSAASGGGKASHSHAHSRKRQPASASVVSSQSKQQQPLQVPSQPLSSNSMSIDSTMALPSKPPRPLSSSARMLAMTPTPTTATVTTSTTREQQQQQREQRDAAAEAHRAPTPTLDNRSQSSRGSASSTPSQSNSSPTLNSYHHGNNNNAGNDDEVQYNTNAIVQRHSTNKSVSSSQSYKRFPKSVSQSVPVSARSTSSAKEAAEEANKPHSARSVSSAKEAASATEKPNSARSISSVKEAAIYTDKPHSVRSVSSAKSHSARSVASSDATRGSMVNPRSPSPISQPPLPFAQPPSPRSSRHSRSPSSNASNRSSSSAAARSAMTSASTSSEKKKKDKKKDDEESPTATTASTSRATASISSNTLPTPTSPRSTMSVGDRPASPITLPPAAPYARSLPPLSATRSAATTIKASSARPPKSPVKSFSSAPEPGTADSYYYQEMDDYNHHHHHSPRSLPSASSPQPAATTVMVMSLPSASASSNTTPPLSNRSIVSQQHHQPLLPNRSMASSQHPITQAQSQALSQSQSPIQAQDTRSTIHPAASTAATATSIPSIDQPWSAPVDDNESVSKVSDGVATASVASTWGSLPLLQPQIFWVHPSAVDGGEDTASQGNNTSNSSNSSTIQLSLPPPPPATMSMTAEEIRKVDPVTKTTHLHRALYRGATVSEIYHLAARAKQQQDDEGGEQEEATFNIMEARDALGNTPLHIACMVPSSRHDKAARFVLDMLEGQAKQEKDDDTEEQQQQHQQLKQPYYESDSLLLVVQLLYNLCPRNVQRKNEDGNLPLHLAVLSATAAVIPSASQCQTNSLISEHQDGSAKSLATSGSTSNAQASGTSRLWLEIIGKIIFEYPLALHMPNRYGQAPLDLAIHKQATCPELVTLIQEEIAILGDASISRGGDDSTTLSSSVSPGPERGGAPKQFHQYGRFVKVGDASLIGAAASAAAAAAASGAGDYVAFEEQPPSSARSTSQQQGTNTNDTAAGSPLLPADASNHPKTPQNGSNGDDEPTKPTILFDDGDGPSRRPLKSFAPSKFGTSKWNPFNMSFYDFARTKTGMATIFLMSFAGLLFLPRSVTHRHIRVAFIGNSITFVNDLPRFMEALSKGYITQNSCLHGATRLRTILYSGNGMYNKWQTDNAFIKEVSEDDDLYSYVDEGDDDDNANNGPHVIYDYGACTVTQLLFGRDDNMVAYNQNGQYKEDGKNPCIEDPAYLRYTQQQYADMIRKHRDGSKNDDDSDPVLKLWDYVVMNDQTLGPALPEERELAEQVLKYVYAPSLKKIGARPVLIATHAYSYDADVQFDEDYDYIWQDVPTFTSALYQGYQRYAEALTVALPPGQEPLIAPAGLAFLVVWEENITMWEKLFFVDGFHPTPHGTFLIGCVLYATLYRRMPSHIPNDVDDLWARARRMELVQEEYEDYEMPIPTREEAIYLAEIAERVALKKYMPKSYISDTISGGY